MKQKRPDPSPADEGAQSVLALDALAEELRTQRDEDGRFVARYPGISKPKIDPNFNKQDWITSVLELTDDGGTLPVTEGSARAFEQLCWWGLRRKKTGVEIFAVGGVSGIPVHTPDGAWIITRIGWRTLK